MNFLRPYLSNLIADERNRAINSSSLGALKSRLSEERERTGFRSGTPEMKVRFRVATHFEIIGFIALIFLIFSKSSVLATTYYYDGVGALNSTTSWFTNRDGTGSNPGNFTAAGNTFTIQNNQSPTLAGSWTINSGSGLLIETGGSMSSGNNTPTLTLSMQNQASYTAAGSSYSGITFGTVNGGSTFEIAGSQTNLLGRTYGNLIWNSTGTVTPADFTTGSSFTIQQSTVRGVGASSATSHTWNIGTDINVSSGAIFRLIDSGGTGDATFNISGGISNAGTISRAGSGIATLNFNGTGSSNATWGTNSGNFDVNIVSGKTITFTDTLSNGTGKIGVTGTLQLGTGGAIAGTGGITVNGGGTLLLGASNKISDGSFVKLNGGTFNTSGFSETVGALTLSSDSVIDFGNSASSILWFSGGSRSGGTLRIDNWSGDPGNGTGTDQLRFTANITDATFLSQITFSGYNPGATTYNSGSGYFLLAPSDVTPVPEPATIIGGIALVAFVSWRERRQIFCALRHVGAGRCSRGC